MQKPKVLTMRKPIYLPILSSTQLRFEGMRKTKQNKKKQRKSCLTIGSLYNLTANIIHDIKFVSYRWTKSSRAQVLTVYLLLTKRGGDELA